MSITTETTIGQIAAEYPLATRVLARHKIDFCCGGGMALKTICEQRGLSSENLINEIFDELSDNSLDVNWNQRTLIELIEHILQTHHRPLEEELLRLETMLKKVHQVHHKKNPEVLDQLLNVYLDMKQELLQHMHKEEVILFPLIKAGRGLEADCPIALMRQEHDSAGSSLQKIRELTDNFTVPEGACNTWRALWHGLENLEKDLHQHIHLENNIFFPRALNGE